MKKNYCFMYKNHKKFKNPKISYIHDKTLRLTSISELVMMKKYLKKKI